MAEQCSPSVGPSGIDHQITGLAGEKWTEAVSQEEKDQLIPPRFHCHLNCPALSSSEAQFKISQAKKQLEEDYGFGRGLALQTRNIS